MLISHSHKFIFVKSKKTAGSSIQDYLAPYCKDGKVEKHYPTSHRKARSIKEIAGDQAWDEYLKICPVRNPWDKVVSWYFWAGRKRSILVKLRRFLKGKPLEDDARKLSFPEYVKSLYERGRLHIDEGIIFLNEEWPDYFFIRYERLHEDMKSLCDRLQVPYKSDKFPSQKTGVRKKNGYRDLYDDETRELVAEVYHREIKKFGYSF